MDPYPVALFEIPPAAVKGVIIGSRMAPEHVARLRQAILSNPELHSLQIQRAVPDASHFLLRFEHDTSPSIEWTSSDELPLPAVAAHVKP
jgi:hypothetical protein